MQKTITYPGIGEVTLSQTHRSTRITLSVRPGGDIRLSFPHWVTQRRALRFLDEKVEWIAATRQKVAEKYSAQLQNSLTGGFGNGPQSGIQNSLTGEFGNGPQSGTQNSIQNSL
ncbi:MAG: M48 family metallopeptidase, partial [Alistipes sp.]|nr:M48 family metallopeptidase [Alistipes sp.]